MVMRLKSQGLQVMALAQVFHEASQPYVCRHQGTVTAACLHSLQEGATRVLFLKVVHTLCQSCRAAVKPHVHSYQHCGVSSKPDMPYLQCEVMKSSGSPLRQLCRSSTSQNFRQALQLLGNSQQAIHPRAEISRPGWHGPLGETSVCVKEASALGCGDQF